MRTYSRVPIGACFAALVLAGGVARGQDAGSIVGWGLTVVVEQSDLDDLTAISGGGKHSIGLKSDSSVVAWGYNEYGECVTPTPNSGFVAVAAGEYHSLALRADSSLVAWGDNGAEQSTVPSPNSNFVAVAAAGAHSLGLRANGSIVAWGDNEGVPYLVEN